MVGVKFINVGQAVDELEAIFGISLATPAIP